MSEPACDLGPDAHCITCGDEGIPMQVVRLGADSAVCIDEHGAEHEVAVDLVAPVAPEQTILVHAGVAIGALS